VLATRDATAPAPAQQPKPERRRRSRAPQPARLLEPEVTPLSSPCWNSPSSSRPYDRDMRGGRIASFLSSSGRVRLRTDACNCDLCKVKSIVRTLDERFDPFLRVLNSNCNCKTHFPPILLAPLSSSLTLTPLIICISIANNGPGE